MEKRVIPILAIGLLGVSFGAPLARYLPVLAALTIAFWRMAGASLLLWGYTGMKGRENLAKPNLKLVSLAGIFLGLHFAFFYSSLKLVPIANATLFATLAPVFSLIYERFFLHRKMTRIALAGLFLAIIGVSYIQGAELQFASDYTRGHIYALTSSLFMAAVLVIGERVRIEITNIAYTKWLYLFAALILLLIILLTKTPVLFQQKDIVWLLALAVIPTLIGHNSMSYAVKYLSPTIVGSMPLGEPLIASIYAWLLFGETVGPHMLAGGLITLTGLGLLSIRR